MKPKRLRIGWFTFTCSGDNTIVFLELMNDRYFEWMKQLDFVHTRILKSKNELKNLDVAFIEGAISSKKEAEELEKIRKNSKKLVAVGACAITGFPSAQRNTFTQEQMKKITPFLKLHNLNEKIEPIKKFVKVDDEVPGCPMDDKVFLKIISKYLNELKNSN
ncbi:MAG: hypothetical protein AB1391_03315 [Candidatus Micrarchaeota archaeon]